MNNKNNIEKNLYELYRTMGSLQRKQQSFAYGAEYVDCEPYNWPATFFGPTTDTEALASLAQAVREGTLPAQWILLRPENYQEFYPKLELEGFRKLMVWPGMGMDLEQTDFSNQQSENVKLIENETELRQWLAIVNKVLFGREPVAYEFFETCWKSGLFDFYGAMEEGEVVATAMTFKTGDDIGIYMVATAETHRRKGLARKITVQILKDAKANDCKNAYLQASRMGAHLYKNLGFESFCTFDIYWLLSAVQRKDKSQELPKTK